MADRRVKVILEAQVDAYNRGMDQAAASTERVAESAEGAGTATRTAGQDVGGARQAFADFGDTMRDINQSNPEFAAGMAIVGGAITGVMGSLVKTGIEYNSLQQVAGKALETMTEDADAAAQQMDRLDEFASTSPFFRDTWLEAQRQLMAFGMEAEDVVPTLEAVEETVAAIGGGDQEIRQLTEILGQIEGQGRITGEELQRMGQMGINAADLMGESLGMTGTQIREEITAGALDADTAIEALTTGMMNNFEGSADAIRDTMQGATNDAIAMWRDLGSIIVEPFVSADGGGILVDVMVAVADAGRAFMELPEIVVQAVAGVVAALGGLALAGGTWGLLGTQIAGFATGAFRAITAVKDLGVELVNATGGIGRFSGALGIAAAAIGGIAAVRWAWDELIPDPATLDEVERSLRDLAATGQHSGGWVGDFGEAYQRVNEEGNWFTRNTPGWVQAMMTRDAASIASTAVTENQAKELEHVDEALSNLVSSGDTEVAAANFNQIAEDMEASGYGAEEIAKQYPEATGALVDMAQAAGISATEAQLLGIATSEAALEALDAGGSWAVINQAYERGEYIAGLAAGEVLALRDALSEQADLAGKASSAIDDLVDSMGEYAGISLSAEETADNWVASLEQVNEALEEGDYNLERNTETGRENRDMLRGIAEDANAAAAARATESGSLEETNAVYDDAIEKLTEAGEAAGMGKEEIDDMIRSYFGFNDVEPIEIQAENRAKEVFDEVEDQFSELPSDWEIRIDALPEPAQNAINAITDGDHEALVEIFGNDEAAQDVITAFGNGDYEAVARIMGDPVEANRVVQDFESGEYVATADIDGNPIPANQAMAAFLNGDYDTVADILGNDAEARSTMRQFLNGHYPTTATIHGDSSSAISTMDSFLMPDWNTTADIHGNDSSARTTAHGFVSEEWATSVGVSADTWSAQSSINALDGQSVTVWVNAARSNHQALVGGDPRQNATGGAIYGPGTGTSDSIPALLSNGEHVIPAREVQMMGGQQAVYAFRSQFRNSSPHQPRGRDMVPGYAAGGAVQARQMAAAMAGSGGGGMSAEASLVGAEVEIGPDGLGRFVDGRVRVSMGDPKVAEAASASIQKNVVARNRRKG